MGSSLFIPLPLPPSLSLSLSPSLSSHSQVECGPLRRAAELSYVNYLPKGAHPFLYLSLTFPPQASMCLCVCVCVCARARMRVCACVRARVRTHPE